MQFNQKTQDAEQDGKQIVYNTLEKLEFSDKLLPVQSLPSPWKPFTQRQI